MLRRSFGPFVLLALAGLYTTPALALRIDKADYALKMVPYDINIRDYQFPSGIRIVFQEDHSRPIVSVSNMIDAGSMDDPAGMDGLAHLVEHLCFRARHGELPKNMDFLRQIGGNFNANTWIDRTIYMTIAPKDSLIPLLRIESLRLVDAVRGVSEEVFQVEREVVRNELRGNLEQGPGDIWGNIQAQLFPEGHPYHYTTIGRHEGLNGITYDRAMSWAREFYRPERSTIVVTGDFSLDDTSRLIQEAFQYEQLVDPKNPKAPLELVELPPRLSAVPPEPPPPVSHDLVKITGMVDNPTIIMGWSLPGGYRGNDMEWELTVGMMNIALGKYLFPDWDYKNEDLDAFGCFFWGAKVNSMALCYLEIAEEEKAQHFVDTALDGLYELWNLDNFYQMERGQYVEGSIPIAEYFQYTKLQAMAQIFSTVEDVSDVSSVRGETVPINLAYTGNPMFYSAAFQEIQAVDPRKAAEKAYKYLNRDRYAAVVMVPMTDDEKAKAERKGLEGTYDGLTRADQGVMLFGKGELTDDAIRRAVVPVDLSSARHFTLENGLEVMIVPVGQAPIARASLLFGGGSDNAGRWGVGDMAWNYAERDHTYSALEFAGASSMSFGETSLGMQIGGSAGNVRAMITDLVEGVTTLDADVMQVAKWVKDTRKARVKEEKKPETWAARRLWESTFPGHVAALYETDEELEFRKTLTAKDANTWLDQVVQPANGVLIVAGNLDPAQTEADVRELFSSWTVAKGITPGRTPGVAPAPDPTARKFYIYPKAGTTQAQLTMMCQLPAPTCENRSARLVLSSAYTEVLYRELRETLGSTYGAYSYQGEQRGGIAYLVADTQIQDKTVSDGIGVMLDTLASIRGQGIDPDMLQTFKWDLARGVTVSYQTTGQVLAGLGGYVNRGCDLESSQQIGEQIATVSNPSVQSLLDRCIGHEVITIVGSKDDMLREVQEAGYEAEVVDWEQWVESDDKDKKDK